VFCEAKNVPNLFSAWEGGAENAGPENARLINVGRKWKAGKRKTGNCRTKMQGW